MAKKKTKFESEWYYFVGSMRVYKATYNSKQLTITVEFTDGVRWDYYSVNAQEWADFLTSESPGKYIYEILDHKPNGKSNL